MMTRIVNSMAAKPPPPQMGLSIPIGNNCLVSVMATGEVTKAGIDRLIDYLKLIRETFP